MSERLSKGIRAVPGVAQRCIVDEFPAVLGTVYGIRGGADIVNGNTVAGSVELAVGVGALVADRVFNRNAQRRSYRAGYETGARSGVEAGSEAGRQRGYAEGIPAGIDIGYQLAGVEGRLREQEVANQLLTIVDQITVESSQVLNGKPIYTSLDQRTAISDPGELIRGLGGVRAGALRAVKIVEDSEKGAISTDQVETLRKVDSFLQLAPALDDLLCEKGQPIVTRMRTLIADAEEQYRQDHPTVIEVPLNEPQA